MAETKQISINEYNYILPDNRIAKYPLNERDQSKLLINKNGALSSAIFNNIDDYLIPNSLLVFNNTKVIRARIEFFKETGARIEIFCLEPYLPADYNMAFTSTENCEWTCIVGNLKKWKGGQLQKDIQVKDEKTQLTISRVKQQGEGFIIKFSWDNPSLTFSEILESTGNIPIPPYLNRKAENSDTNRYQTIYSKHKGSVAAPTAGLHFTNNVFDKINKKGISRHEITLHVGAGTFKPVKANEIGDHEMHYEQFLINENTIPEIINHLGKITVVGTTTVRTLESLYWLGVKIISNNSIDDFTLNQWDAYSLPNNIDPEEALLALHNKVMETPDTCINASTGIMIAPGYNFKTVNHLITNFHQPKSTLLLLIAAFLGESWKDMYKYALTNDFRFLSYGDSCLLTR